MSYLSRLALGLTPYTAGEQPASTHYIKLNTNENPYPPSPKVAAAIQGAVPRLPLYPDMDASPLREALASQMGLSPAQVFCGNGSDEVLAFAFAAFFAGKTLAAPDVTYSFYPVYAKLFNVNYVTAPVLGDWQVDVKALMQNTPVALANPNAPTGRYLSLDELRPLAEHTKQAHEVLLIDEAYTAFAPGSALSLLHDYDNVLIVRTFSKSHSLAGLRVGYALGSEELIAGLNRVKNSFNSYPLDCLAQAAALAAIMDTGYYSQTTRQMIDVRDAAYQKLTQNGIQVVPSHANFIFVKADDVNAAPVLEKLKENGILARHFNGPRTAPYLRVSIGTQAQMDKAVQVLITLLALAFKKRG